MQVRDRRALLIGGAAIVVAYVGARGVPGALAAVSSLEDRVSAQSSLLQAARLRVARRSVLSDSLDLLRESAGRATEQLLEAVKPAEAREELGQRITVALSRHPVRIHGIRPLSDSVSEWPARAGALVVFEGDVRGLAATLGELESDPRLNVERIDVSATDPLSGNAVAEVLRMEVEIMGYFVSMDAAQPASHPTSPTGGNA